MEVELLCTKATVKFEDNPNGDTVETLRVFLSNGKTYTLQEFNGELMMGQWEVKPKLEILQGGKDD